MELVNVIDLLEKKEKDVYKCAFLVGHKNGSL